MRHDHVAERPRFLVEARPHPDRERLGNVDLHMVDVVAVPDRLEHPVGETQRQQVLHGLPADVVIDAKDLLLVEDREKAGVELPSGSEVEPEGLLGDHMGPVAEPELSQRANGRAGGLRRQRQVVQDASACAKLLPRLLDRGAQKIESIADGDEAEALGEPIQSLARRRAATGILHSLASHFPELLLAGLSPGGADDAKAPRHQPHLSEVEHPRQQFALGEIAGRPEKHDHVILGNALASRPRQRAQGRSRHSRFQPDRYPTAPKLTQRWRVDVCLRHS